MPHLRLEYSSNVTGVPKASVLFEKLHAAMHDVAHISQANCKSRMLKTSDYFVADGSYGQAFVHLEVRLLAGRSNELKQSLGEALLQLLLQEIGEHNSTLDLQTTVELVEMERASYFKYPAGTLSQP